MTGRPVTGRDLTGPHVTGPLVVVGDALLDRDVDGTVSRLCPDAPAPVLDERSTVDRPGGAGLAALFAAADGLDVVLVTALADDPAAERLRDLLSAAGVRIVALPTTGGTPEKIRLRTDGRTLLRLDRGGSGAAPGAPREDLSAVLGAAGAILVSDYGRGVAAHPAVRRALMAAAAPIVWDPHPRGPSAVPGVCLVTPNELELTGLVDVAVGSSRLSAATERAHELCRQWDADSVAVTMGGDGALLCPAGTAPTMVAADAAGPGADTCGAGDRFAVAAAGALARGALPSGAVREAVERAAAYVRAGGLAALSTPDPRPAATGTAEDVVDRVRAAGGTVVATGGCFDLLHAGHLATLEAARKLGDCLVVCLNSDRSVADLKGPQRPLTTEADRSRLLSALRCVDAVVVFDEPTPHTVLSRLRPDIWVKGGDYTGDLPEADLVRSWGGRTVLVPYVDGRSTTGTIAAARTGAGIFAEGRT